MEIFEFLEESHPDPALRPQDIHDRAWVRSICNAIACDIHPLNNLRVLKYLKHQLKCDDEQRDTWYRHWIQTGFEPLEKVLATRAGRYCLGDAFTLADAFLVPQVWNALRFKHPIDRKSTRLNSSH